MSPLRRLGAAFLTAVLAAQLLTACGPAGNSSAGGGGLRWEDLEYDHSLELQYAQQFSVDYYQGGYALVEIRETGTYLVVPPEADVPSGLDEGVTVLQQPLDRIYLAATSAMDLFRELDGLDAIRLSGTEAQGWYVEEARSAMEAGEILYAGKYSAPDYERIYAEGCDLAVYEVGRSVKELPGVLEAKDMTPEAVAVKLMWALGQTTDRAEAMRLFTTPVEWDIV